MHSLGVRSQIVNLRFHRQKRVHRRTSSNTRLSRSAQPNVLDEYEAVFSIFLTLREELLSEKYIQDIKNRLRRSLLHELLSFVQCSSSGGFNTFSRITWLTASEDLRNLPRGIPRKIHFGAIGFR